MRRKSIKSCVFYKNEFAFKRFVLGYLRTKYYRVFEIENEKEPGMPDILAVTGSGAATFIELKYVRKDGKVKFQPTQPVWYKRNSGLNIHIYAYDSRNKNICFLDPKEVVKQKTLEVRI